METIATGGNSGTDSHMTTGNEGSGAATKAKPHLNSTTIDLTEYPRAARLDAVKQIMQTARSLGLSGMAGECGTLALAMNTCLFAGKGEIIGGLNKKFLEHDHLIGHFVVRIDDEEDDCVNFDEMGVPLPDDDVLSWGMLDPEDPDWSQHARENGFEMSDAIAEEAVLIIFDSEEDVLQNMPGTGVANKYRMLGLAIDDFLDPDLRLAAEDRSADQNVEFDRRVRAVRDLNNRSGVAFLFWEKARRAIRHACRPNMPKEADWNRPIDWKTVEDATISAALGARQQNPEEVINVLRKYSPGILSEKQSEAVQRRVNAYVRAGIGSQVKDPVHTSASSHRIAP